MYKIICVIFFGFCQIFSIAHAAEHLYFGAGGGYARMQKVPGPITKHFNYGARAYVGYQMDFHQRFDLGSELGCGVYSVGKLAPRDTDQTFIISSMGADLNMIGTYHLDQKVSVFAKAGAIYERFIVENKGRGRTLNPQFGGGVLWSLTKHFGLKMNYMHVLGQDIEKDFDSKNGKLKSHHAPIVDYMFLNMEYRQ